MLYLTTDYILQLITSLYYYIILFPVGCYTCGDLSTRTGVSKDQCQIPSGNSTEETAGFATVEKCYSGKCIVREIYILLMFRVGVDCVGKVECSN